MLTAVFIKKCFTRTAVFLFYSKSVKEIAGTENAFIIADNLDFAIGHRLPIWLFGLLY